MENNLAVEPSTGDAAHQPQRRTKQFPLVPRRRGLPTTKPSEEAPERGQAGDHSQQFGGPAWVSESTAPGTFLQALSDVTLRQPPQL